MKISINCPSYKRPKVETLDYIPQCKIWVDEGEYEEYLKANPKFKKNIISCPKGVQGNLCRIRNYILDEEFKKGNDVVLIVDDDMKEIAYWEKDKRHKLKTEEIENFLHKYSSMAKEFGAYFWGININSDKQVYREYTPLSTTSYIGGPFQAFLKGGGIRYDERLPLKEDYDMTLQQLNKHRVVLRVNKFYYMVKQAKQKGGCATFRNFEREKAQLNLLQKKWGKKIVRVDTSERNHSMRKKKTKIDFNPVIRPPIKGV